MWMLASYFKRKSIRKMKTALTILFLTLSISLFSQLAITYTPEHTKFGLFSHCEKSFGVYLRADYGEINAKDCFAKEFKSGIGMSYRCDYFSLLIGYANTQHFSVVNNNPLIDLDNVYKNSIEVGAVCYVSERFSTLLIIDVLSFQGLIGIGIKFW